MDKTFIDERNNGGQHVLWTNLKRSKEQLKIGLGNVSMESIHWFTQIY